MESHRASSSSSSPVRLSRPRAFQFKVTSVGISPPIWRQIQVPTHCAFSALHSAIQGAMGWENRHSYRFEQFSRRPEITSIELPADDCPIGPYFVNVGDAALYVCDDEGSRWEFQMEFEKMAGAVQGVSCPPEEIRGVKAFQNLMTVPDSIGLVTSMGYLNQFNPRSVVFRDPKELFELIYEP